MNLAPTLSLAGTAIAGVHADPTVVKRALRTLAGGVSVITAGKGEDRTGATVTSATGLSMDPPTMIVNINKGSSTWRQYSRRWPAGDRQPVRGHWRDQGHGTL
jgi:hypothetical protein